MGVALRAASPAAESFSSLRRRSLASPCASCAIGAVRGADANEHCASRYRRHEPCRGCPSSGALGVPPTCATAGA